MKSIFNKPKIKKGVEKTTKILGKLGYGSFTLATFLILLFLVGVPLIGFIMLLQSMSIITREVALAYYICLGGIIPATILLIMIGAIGKVKEII